MGTLSPLLNTLLQLHSKKATLKRFGTPDLFSPIRITSSNYFRFLEGPSHAVIRGREFIIPVESMLGSQVQVLGLDEVATDGTFIFRYDGQDTSLLSSVDDASTIQSELRLLAGLENVLVTGSFASQSFSIAFVGVENPEMLEFVRTPGDLLNSGGAVVRSAKGLPWAGARLKRGDKIAHPDFGSLAIDEIIEMPDLGGDTMAYRVRTE